MLDEVRVKTHVIERTKNKLESVEEDMKDLSAEFELDRQDYLGTIRDQNKQIKLYEQLLTTVVPCLRRDCNYFNIDKIKVDCVWNDDSSEWDLPKLTVSQTALAPAPGPAQQLPKGPMLDRRKGNTPAHAPGKRNSISDSDIRDPANPRNGQGNPQSSDNLDDGKYLAHLQQKSDDSMDYFKPKRARELIGSHPGHSPHHNHPTDTSTSVKSSGSSGSLTGSNAAAVHGISNDANYSRRPGKLQSLSENTPAPPNIPAPKNEPADMLEKVEKKMATRKNLEPLVDIKTKKS
jgi:kinesin family protein 3/17